MKICAAFFVSLVLALHSFAMADPAAKADFGSGTLPESWSGLKGEWKVSDGTMTGAELESDKHAAVLLIPDPHFNSTFSFRFRLDGAKGFHLSYNHAKDHLFRVTVSGDAVTLRMDKDKKDSTSEGELLATGMAAFKPGEWVEMTCSVEGATAKVTCGGVTLAGTHADLAKEKTGYRFVVQGTSVVFDDVVFASTK